MDEEPELTLDEKNRLLGSLIRTWIAEGNEVILRNRKGESMRMELKGEM